VRANARAGRAPIEAHGTAEEPSLAPSVAGHVVRVRVDRDTGAIEVLADHVVQDVGRVLNPALVAGQQHGAAAQGVGWATLEELIHDGNGQLVSGTFLDYALPRAGDVGRLETTSVEVPAPDGPLGAKGIGEAPVIPGPAAVANAVAAATGVRLRDLPMGRRRAWEALRRGAGE
jgi:CO/xanthine dehydrogenase Mo-binding subunit